MQKVRTKLGCKKVTLVNTAAKWENSTPGLMDYKWNIS